MFIASSFRVSFSLIREAHQILGNVLTSRWPKDWFVYQRRIFFIHRCRNECIILYPTNQYNFNYILFRSNIYKSNSTLFSSFNNNFQMNARKMSSISDLFVDDTSNAMCDYNLKMKKRKSESFLLISFALITQSIVKRRSFLRHLAFPFLCLRIYITSKSWISGEYCARNSVLHLNRLVDRQLNVNANARIKRVHFAIDKVRLVIY